MRSACGVLVAHGVRGEDIGVVSTDDNGGRSLGGVDASVPPEPQQPPPEERRRERRDERRDDVPCGLPKGVGSCMGDPLRRGVGAAVD